MVEIGDKIETEDGIQGYVTDILESVEGRYLIFFKDKRHPHYFIEGDKKFKILNSKRKTE